MNKMKKLLSVLLAVIIAMSCMSVMSSAAITQYQDVSELEALAAYSPYGTVTRLSTEERMSIVYDFLDVTLPKLNINMGEVINLLGISITINLTSVDNLCISLDSFANSTSGIMWAIAKGLLGVLGDLSFDTWQTGITREGSSSLLLVSELAELLAANKGVVGTIINDGKLDLGLVGSFLKGVDLSGIEDILGDIPGLVKGLIFPMFERWDHTTAEIDLIETALKGDGNVVSNLKWIVEDMLTREQSITTVKADANGNIISSHTLPTSGTRQTYTKSGTTITVKHYYTQSDVDKDELDDITAVGYMEIGTYVLAPEYTDENGAALADTEYVFQYTDEWGNVQNLKYYETGSYFLPSFVEDGGTIDITTETGANLLYKMIPYVFAEMAPTVVNGSLKKLLAGFFGVQWENLGDITDAEVLAEVQALPGYDASLEVFGEQGEYLWEWSAFDMITVDGVNHYYYRFQDDIFVGDASKANEYMEIINWDFRIEGTFIDKYIPANTSSTSAAGYSKILHAVNQFLVDLATEVVNLDVINVTLESGDNTKLVDNIKVLAQAILSYHPEHIFGSAYEDEDHYYNLIVGDDKDLVLTGIGALVVDLLAKQVILPGATSLKTQGVKVGAILAAMLRELATQLLPHYDYDALIYSDYNTRTFLSGKDNSYWLDVLLTIGVDIGMKYLHNLADMNEDTDAWKALGYGSESMTTEVTYSASTFDQTGWEDKVDYILDWALTSTSDGSILTWSMTNLVGKYVTDAGYTIDLATAQDPWVKIDAIFDNILFLDQFTSETDLKAGLRGTIEDLVNLNWQNILGTPDVTGLIDVPSSSRLVSTNILSALTLEVRDLINGLFKNVGGGSYYFIPESIADLDAFATQSNLSTIVQNLLGALPTAYSNGLMITVLPFINMFLGWSTDDQKYATPSIYMNSEYVYAASDATTASTTFNIVNNSSGMLLKHRANIKSDGTFSSILDNPYTLKVTNVECNVEGTTYDKTSVDVAPYGTSTITATLPYSGTDFVARFIITYSFTGKDGNPVGGEMKLVVYQLFTSTAPESSTVAEIKDGTLDSYCVYVSAYESYVYTNDLYSAVMGQKGTISYSEPLSGAPDRVRISHAITSTAMASNASQYFSHVYTESTNNNPQPLIDLGWDIYFGGAEEVDGKPNGTSGGLYTANSGVTADTEFPLGLYDMGSIEMHTYKQDYDDCNSAYEDGGNGRDIYWTYKFYYYEDYDVDASVAEYTGKMLLADDFSAEAQDEFATYETALMNVVKLAQYPITCSFNDTIRPQIEDAVAALDAAYEALMEAEGNADASAEASDISGLEAELAKDDGDGEVEINFQDYDLFEYFEYQDYRTANRNLVKTFYAPEVLEKYYVEGSGVTYKELSESIIPGATETIGAAITASLSERTDEEILASQKAYDEFVAPVIDELYLDDQITRLAWYRQFILPITADLTFIDREEAYAEANFPINDTTAALYTEDSWTAYVEAYDNATSMTTSNIPSEVFAAKYALMVTMRNLLLKSESAIEAGATAELVANAAEADKILAMNLADIVLSQEAIDAGLTVEEALAELIVARGYYYTGEDGNEWQLYADSADEYIDNDRPNVSTNIARIDTCNENLVAAIALFDMGVEAPELGVVDGTTGAFGTTTTDETTGLVTGYIYGVTAGDTAENYFALVDEATGTVEWTASAGGATNGTGATATVKDTAGTTVAVYTLVIFGDVNGDGSITSNDYADVKTASLGGAITGEAYNFAADVNGDSSITSNDYADVKTASLGGTITVNPYVG